MRNSKRPSLAATGLLARLCTLCILLSSPTLQAAELYVTAEYGISQGLGSVDVNHQFDQAREDSDDASPVLGAGLGLALPLHELLPLRMSLPRIDLPIWPGKALTFGGHEDWRFPDWDVRFELAYLDGREYDFRADGADPWFTNGKARSLMATARLDLPVQAPLTALFGRIPILDPLTVYGAAGVGAAHTEAVTLSNQDKATKESFEFAWEVDAGLGYAISDALHLSIGWRYIDLGTTQGTIKNAGTNRGRADVDMRAHEFTTSIRYSFWRVPFFEGTQ